LKKTVTSLLAAVGLTTASFAHAVIISNTFRINGADVEMVASNTSDVPVTLVSVKILGVAAKGKDSPVLFALAPATVIPAKQQATVVLGKAADIRRASPRAAEFEQRKFCVGPVEPCLEAGARNTTTIEVAIETMVVAGDLTQRTWSAMPIHFVANYSSAQ
jgi:hypothetical protein